MYKLTPQKLHIAPVDTGGFQERQFCYTRSTLQIDSVLLSALLMIAIRTLTTATDRFAEIQIDCFCRGDMLGKIMFWVET